MQQLTIKLFILFFLTAMTLSAAEQTESPIRWNAVDFGVTSDESVDNTATLQAVLDQAGQAGGGLVELPSGRFRFDGTLSIPAGVTLCGTYRVPPTIHNAAQIPNGTTLLAYAGRGKPEEPPFIRLAGSNSAVKGLAIIYPEWKQTDVPPVPYPPCIFSEHTDNVAVIDCCLLNPYEGIKFVLAARHLVRNVTGYPIKRGLFVDQCYDIGHIENIHFWPFGVFYQPDDPYCKWINLEGVAFELARTDWHYVSNTFCFGYGVGYKFSEYEHGGTNGNFLGIGADSCRRAVLVEQAQEPGLLITNGEFVGRWSSEDSICLEIQEKCEGKVSLNNCSFWGPVQTCILMKSPKGQLTTNVCHFVNWDEVHRSHKKKGSPAIQLDAGKTILQGSTFEKAGTHVLVGKEVKSAILMGNQAQGGFFVDGTITPRIQMVANEQNPMDIEPASKEWFRVLFGTSGDETFFEGLFYPEKRVGEDTERSFRWSQNNAQFILPVVPNKDYELTFVLDVPQTALFDNDDAGLYFQNQKVASLQVGHNVLTFPVKSDGQKIVCELRCQGWIPAQIHENSTDDRELGVSVFSVEAKMIETELAAPFDANRSVWTD